MSLGVFIGIGTTVLLIAGLLIFGATRDLLLKFFDWIFNITFKFFDVCPKPLKIFIFLFFLIFIVGSVVNGFLGIMFFCDGTTVYQPDNFFNGVGLAISSSIAGNETLGNLTSPQYQSILEGNSVIYNTPDPMTPEGLISVQCEYNKPKLTLFGINMFDYRIWIFLLILGGLIGFYAFLKKT